MSSIEELLSNLKHADSLLSAVLQMKSFGLNAYSMQVTLRKLLNELSYQQLDIQMFTQLKQMEKTIQAELDPFFNLQPMQSLSA